MSSNTYRREVQRHQQEIARLQREKARDAKSAADETRKAASAADSARRATNISIRQARLRDTQRHESLSVRYQEKIADLEEKIARKQGLLNEAHRKLAAAEQQEERKRQQQHEREMRESRRTIDSIHGELSQHAQLHNLTLSTLQKLKQLPERITVLFLAANPLDQQQLRLDEEVRSIAEMIRKSQHRDSVRLESRWGVRPHDVLQAINECRPRIVHFSGHGTDQDEIVFQDDAGQTKLVSLDALIQIMAAGSDAIQLVFLNTCYSRRQAEAIVEHIPAAIGMKTSIDDLAARIFAAQFYSAIGFGLSIARAFQQARAALMLEGISEDDTPELFIADGLSTDSLVLVRPPKHPQNLSNAE